PGRPGGRRLDRLDDVLGGADVVGPDHHLVPALGVDEHVDAGDAAPYVLDALGGEPAVDRAVPAPQDHPGVADLTVGEAAVRPVRVVDDAVVQGHAQLQHRGVAAQVLVGQEKDLLPFAEGPFQGAAG